MATGLVVRRVAARQPWLRRLLMAGGLLVLAGCVSQSIPVEGAPRGDGNRGGGNRRGSPVVDEGPVRTTWQVKVREHVDLWLHGYAMLTDDSADVPLFRPGWRDEVVVFQNQRNILTALDTGRTSLALRLKRSPSMQAGQFAAMYFATNDEMRAAIAAYLASNGDPRKAGERVGGAAIFAAAFPTPADRDWLRQFSAALQDDYDRWWHQWWVQQQQQRAVTLQAIVDAWGRLRPRLSGYLRGTQQPGGEVLVSLPVGGEGRTVVQGKQVTLAVPFPARVGEAPDALYGLVHELAGTLAAQVVNDNTTPAEKRAGIADRMNATAAVRTGAFLLERAAPEYAEGYKRFYLSQVRSGRATDFARAFPLPPVVEQALIRQIEIVLGGI